MYPHMGMKLKELAREKKMSANEIADKMGLTRQGVYNIYTRQTVGTAVFTSFCNAIGIKPETVNRISEPITSDKTSNESEYLSKYIQELEQRVAEQSRTIAQLAQSNQALIEKLGKFSASGLLAELDA